MIEFSLRFLTKQMVLLSVISGLTACGGGVSDNEVVFPESSEESGTETPDNSNELTLILQPEKFSSSTMLSSFELVECTLTDGTATQCYQATFRNEPDAYGPLCPLTENDTGGIGFYDGDTNPGLHVLNSELWAAFAADGYDIIDADGNVNVIAPTGGPGSGGGIGGDSSLNGSCLDAVLETDLVLTYTIPAYPYRLSEYRERANFEFPGISVDGFPMAEPPPATVTNMGAAIPALDPCGGHPQPAGPFHWHIVPHEANNVLAAHDIYEVQCSNVAQVSDQLIGYANDGFPIYGAEESDGSVATGLDACRGHESATNDYPDGVYHYHISSTEAPNTLSCFAGPGVSSHEFINYQ